MVATPNSVFTNNIFFVRRPVAISVVTVGVHKHILIRIKGFIITDRESLPLFR